MDDSPADHSHLAKRLTTERNTVLLNGLQPGAMSVKGRCLVTYRPPVKEDGPSFLYKSNFFFVYPIQQETMDKPEPGLEPGTLPAEATDNRVILRVIGLSEDGTLTAVEGSDAELKIEAY
ncbi:unnamed protein product, partial [Protopolystoma xenopodis]